jgi:REP element-mobilizing transposase RayT/mRNA-degrading endonuclease RelE of RelBE toxin-antitoxin system
MLRPDFTRDSRKFLEGLQAKQQKRISSKIAELLANPRPQDAAPIKNSPDHNWKTDIGEFRIAYRIEGDILKVILVSRSSRSGNAGVPPAPSDSHPGSADASPTQNDITPGNSGVSPARRGELRGGNAGVPPAKTPDALEGWRSRGYIPHFDPGCGVQFITLRLHDAVPLEAIQGWKQELRFCEKTTQSLDEAVALRNRIAEYEDAGHGMCYLREDRIAKIVQDALLFLDGQRYHLLAWCIMPNHIHVLISLFDGQFLSRLIHSWKSFTAHQVNNTLKRSGRFWMPDYFDRYIRSERHFLATVRYIHENPVKANLVKSAEEWRWSSARKGE